MEEPGNGIWTTLTGIMSYLQADMLSVMLALTEANKLVKLSSGAQMIEVDCMKKTRFY